MDLPSSNHTKKSLIAFYHETVACADSSGYHNKDINKVFDTGSHSVLVVKLVTCGLGSEQYSSWWTAKFKGLG